MCADIVLGQTMAELATWGRDPNGSRDSNFPGINIPTYNAPPEAAWNKNAFRCVLKELVKQMSFKSVAEIEVT